MGLGLRVVGISADGGDTISDVTPGGIGLDQIIEWFDALGAAQGSVVVSRLTGTGAFLYRTRDAGASWTKLRLPQSGRVHFLDWEHGWLLVRTQRADHTAEDLTLLRTTNGGITWGSVYRTTQRTSIQPGFQPGDCLWIDFTFVSVDTGYAGLSCPTSVPRGST